MATIIADTPDLIPNLCQQFSQATGWNLQYELPGADQSLLELELQLQGHADCCWLARIGEANRETGLLYLVAPEATPHLNFVQATDMAEAIAQLLGKLDSANRRLESRNKDVSTLVNLGLAVPQENLAWALNQLLRAATQLSSTRSAAFFLLNQETNGLRLRAVYQLQAEEMPLANRGLLQSPVDVEALADGPVAVRREQGHEYPWLPDDARAALCVAVQSETVPIGTLWVYDRRARGFSQRDRHVLQSIAAQVAAVLERVALLRGSETRDRIVRELQVASENQCTITPNDLPADPRFEVAAHCASCYELGGDLCELIPLCDDRFALAVGDACGNSIPAAMIMSAVRGALRTHAACYDEIVPLMERLNDALHGITRTHQFMSLCYGVYDARTRCLNYSNAGHPLPILVRQGRITNLESHGLLLGVVRDSTYEASVLELQPEDVLIFYSDGISEARCMAQRMFRADGICSSAVGHAHESAANILQAIWSNYELHIAGGEAADDRTLLVLKVH